LCLDIVLKQIKLIEMNQPSKDLKVQKPKVESYDIAKSD